MKLSEWAKLQGINYQTAFVWFKNGKLPVPAYQTATGTILVNLPPATEGQTAVYVRVSSHDQKSDIERQVARITMWATGNGYNVGHIVTDIGAGINGHRSKLMKLLADPKYTTIIVEHRDRLMRFGSEYIEATLAAQGRKLVAIDPTELNNDLVEDVLAVLTSFCSRLYGNKSAKNKAKKALALIQETTQQ